MSFAIKIVTEKDTATPVVRVIVRSVAPAALNPIIGRSVVNTFREHLFGVDRSRPNALGGTRTHFYASAARGTSFTVVPDGVVVSIASVGIRQRILGGTIRPRTAKYLTIPAVPEAYGKRASEFDDLVVVFGAGGQPIGLAHAAFRRTQAQLAGLAPRLRVGTTRSFGAHGGIVFWFRKSVTQQPDPTVLPHEELTMQRVGRDVKSFVDRNVARARQQSGGSTS